MAMMSRRVSARTMRSYQLCRKFSKVEVTEMISAMLDVTKVNGKRICRREAT